VETVMIFEKTWRRSQSEYSTLNT